MSLRRDSDYDDDAADGDEPEFSGRARRQSVRLNFDGGLMPKTLWGRIAAGGGLLCVALAAVAGGLWVRSYLLHDAHFVVPGSESIQIAGNSHVSRPQLLSVFGEDVDRNIFNIPLAVRRGELESLPWVEHATVMRLLPNRVRVAIVERTPVAFVRQGTQIGLVDANGVLFDLPGPDVDEASGGQAAIARNATQYSFPVLTGISAGDPLSVRAARMRIYLGFVAALDANGEAISRRLSEVDLSNPEDVKAVIPDAGTSGADILVHFGEEKYLERYHQYQAHLAEWRAQYPKLASVDMRYEQQVVLEMRRDAVVAATAGPNTGSDATAANATGDGASAAGAKPDAAKAAAMPASTHAPVAKAKKPVAKAQVKPTGVAHAQATSQNVPQGAAQ
jgi:cell division protein FtsQ